MKKFFIFFALSLISLPAVFALPGFKAVVPDTAGEYVYYQDSTFERESFIGFLMYDQKTYSARYYAPAEKKSKLPEKEIQIFFTLNPDANHLELTGEKVLNMQLLGEEDLKIVNYLHDLLYEFSARRIKLVENNTLSGTQDELEYSGQITSNEDFAQFGGSVQIKWNTIVPLFNIESIHNENDAKNVLSAATIGRITSSGDKSFENFRGFPKNFKTKKHTEKISRKAEKLEIQNEKTGNQITLRSDWKKLSENAYSLGESALLIEGAVPEKNLNFIKRQILLGSDQNYLDFSSLEFKNNTFKANYYNFQSGNVNTTFKKIEKNSENGQFSLCLLSIFSDVYKKNASYFNEIIESFSTQKQLPSN